MFVITYKEPKSQNRISSRHHNFRRSFVTQEIASFAGIRNEMEYLKKVETVEDITEELSKVIQEENEVERRILFNLTGSLDYYDISSNGEAVKASAIEYNEVSANLRLLGENVNSTESSVACVITRNDKVYVQY